MDTNTTDTNEPAENQMIDDEALARQLQNEYLEELFIEQQQQQQQEAEQAAIRRKQNEENARIRLEQDMAYLESLQVIPRKESEQMIQPIPKIVDIPPPPPPQLTPPSHFICPISRKIMNTPMRDTEDNICYDKTTLLEYLQVNDNKNHNGKVIQRRHLEVDLLLKNEISLWRREHPEYME
jgi:hypothetical protein